jgi:acyl-CoA dehydrogenase
VSVVTSQALSAPLSGELEDLRASLSSFIEREVRPREQRHAEDIRRTGTFPGIDAERDAIRKRAVETGFWTLYLPEDIGGGGLSYLGQVAMQEECARHGLVLAMFESIFPEITGPTRSLARCTDDQKERYLFPLMRAERKICFALTEPDAGSDATRIRTRARREDGRWVLDGRKVFITGGDRADVAIVFAVNDPEKRARGGITAFLVDTDTTGFSVARVHQTMSPHENPAELVLEGVRVPEENVLGEVGQGLYYGLEDITTSRFQIAGTALGIAQYLVDRSVQYARDRIAFDRPIGANQYVQGLIVDSILDLQQARLLVYWCAQQLDAGLGDQRMHPAMAKLVAAQMVNRVADRSVQVHGGNGYVTEFGVEMWYRQVRIFRIYEGTDEILRVNIAKSLGY